MTKEEKIYQSIHHAIDQLNARLPEGKRLPKDKDTVLFGESGVLDSLGLVHLIVAVEVQIDGAFGRPVTLADERAVSQKHSPFATIASLAAYIADLLQDSAHA